MIGRSFCIKACIDSNTIIALVHHLKNIKSAGFVVCDDKVQLWLLWCVFIFSTMIK